MFSPQAGAVMYFDGFYNECDSGGHEYFLTMCSNAGYIQIVEEVGSTFHLQPQIVGMLQDSVMCVI